MLTNSFTYIPVLDTLAEQPVWKLISDLVIAKYLRSGITDDLIKERLGQTLEDAVRNGGIKLLETRICSPDILVANAIKEWDGLPILIVSSMANDLIGIVTSFDLL